MGDSHEKSGFFFFFLLDKRLLKRFCMGYFDYLRTSHVYYRLLLLNFCLHPPTIVTYTHYLNYKKKLKEEGDPPTPPPSYTLYHRSYNAVRIDIAHKPRSFLKLIIDLVARYSVFSTSVLRFYRRGFLIVSH